MSVGKLCNRDVVCAKREASVAGGAQLMRRYHVGDIVVVDRSDDRVIPVGVLTDQDIVVEVVAAGVDPSESSSAIWSRAHCTRSMRTKARRKPCIACRRQG